MLYIYMCVYLYMYIYIYIYICISFISDALHSIILLVAIQILRDNGPRACAHLRLVQIFDDVRVFTYQHCKALTLRRPGGSLKFMVPFVAARCLSGTCPRGAPRTVFTGIARLTDQNRQLSMQVRIGIEFK